MAIVKPFKAWRYDEHKTPRLSDVIVPPYDVISEEELTEMDTLSPFNYSKVILAKGENKHRKAAEKLRQWQKEKILVHENTPGYYFYKQEFKLDRGEKMVRYGFFAKVQVEEYKNNVILPHEKTFAKYKADRYELMEAAQGNMEPVFLGYDSDFLSGGDFEEIVKKSKSLYDYQDRYGVKHKLWLVDDKVACRVVEKTLAKLKLYILDGHHRYETALKFHQDHGGEKTRYVLANICAFKQPGTVILPTHRLINNIPDFSKDKLMDELKQKFEIQKVNSIEDLEVKLNKNRHISFGLRFGGEKDLYLISLKEPTTGVLDLDYLHGTLLSGISKNQELKIHYVRNTSEFVESLNNTEFQLGFFIRPNSSDDVIQKAAHGEVMPHKSTFFYPKIPSGLVIHCFE